MNHSIQKLTVEIHAGSQAEARQRHGELSRWCRTDSLWSKLSERLSSLVPDDVTLHISKLEIDVNVLDENTFQTEMIEKIAGHVRELPSFSKHAAGTLPEEYVRQMTLVFLKNGFFPSHIASDKVAQARAFLEMQVSEPDMFFWREFANHTRHSPQILSRLIQHLGLQAVREIFVRLLREHFRLPINVSWIEEFWEHEGSWRDVGQLAVLVREENLWLYFLQNPGHEGLKNKETFVDQCYQIIAGRTAKNTSNESVADPSGITETEARMTKSAGLVLISPFFTQLFDGLGWLEKGMWLDEEKPHLAARLLTYLAHGITEDREDDCLPKILCGLQLETVVRLDLALTEAHLETADQLLLAVIGFWTTLKSMSVTDLRSLFLRRRGRLVRQDEDWCLEVEKQGQDQLIHGFPATPTKPGVEGIPWGFGVVSLPWTGNVIYVKW